jgi:DNA-binding transcriptional regulator PaaX
MVTRGGKSIIEVLDATAKYYEELQGYVGQCWNIVPIKMASITLSSLLERMADPKAGYLT